MKRIFLLTFLASMLAFQAMAQRTVTGTVKGPAGGTLPGVNVLVVGTGSGAATDLDGKYRVDVPGDDAILRFTYTGYDAQEITVGARSVIDVTMSEAAEVLSEVLVVGYGTQSQKLSTQQVSQVGSENINNLPVLSAQEALQGQAAGVQLTSTSGVAGSRQNIRIRGVASLTAGGDPLFVVDGVPMNNGSYSSGSGATSLNPLMELNPSEIENISILKDASAVAIYGSRGANGVILITTKKGSSQGKSQINLDWYTGTSTPTVIRPVMNTAQYKEFWTAANAGLEPAFGPNALGDPTAAPDTYFNWPDAVIRQGSVSNYNLSVRGGDEKTRFFVSGTYFDQEAYTIGNEFQRLNGRVNVDHTVNNRVTIGTNLSLAYTNNDRISSDNSTFAPLTTSYLQVPWAEPYDENGQFVNLGFLQNVLGLEALRDFNLQTRRTTGNIFMEIDIIDDLLKFRTDWGTDQIQTEEYFRTPDLFVAGGTGTRQIWQDIKFLTTNTLSFENYLGDGSHFVSALVGYSYEQADQEYIGVSGSGFVSDALPNVASAATPTFTSASGTGWRLNSLFARANYRFKDKYLLEGSFRRDGSSRFGAGRRFGNFWAGSAGWVFSEEAFLDGVSAISFGKLTASYGIAGNDQIGNFSSLGLYAAGADYNGRPGLRPSNPANRLLSWEQTAQLDVTLNIGLFNDRVNLETSYYNKNTEGLLLNVPIPYTTGFSSVTQNAGTMTNQGIDVLLKTVNIDGDFRWTTDLNFGYLDNEVTSLPGAAVDAQERQFLGGANNRAIVGESASTFYLVRYQGVNPETGDGEWLTVDGEITDNPSAGDDRVVVGSAIPTLTGGFRNTFSYKGFEASAFFIFQQGGSVFYDDLEFTRNPLNAGAFNLDPILLDYWQQAGDQAFLPNLSAVTSILNFASTPSTAFLRSSDYIRLRNAVVAYNFPKSLLDASGFLTRARIYIQGQNLLTFNTFPDTDLLEVEVNDAANSNVGVGESFFTPPQPRAFTVGVSLGF